MKPRPRSQALCLLVLAATFLASIAAAQARVVVEVRNPGGAAGDGEITLTPEGGGRSYSCRTQQGSCEIVDVPGGTYVATLRPEQGEPPSPRTVVIPPSGRVTLRVSTR